MIVINSFQQCFDFLSGYFKRPSYYDRTDNPFGTVFAEPVMLLCQLYLLRKIYSTENFAVEDLIALLVWVGAFFIPVASYTAHHIELKPTASYTINDDNEFVFWFFLVGTAIGMYYKKVDMVVFVQTLILAVLMASSADIKYERELRFDTIEFLQVWFAMFIAFGLLPIISLHKQILDILLFCRGFSKYFNLDFDKNIKNKKITNDESMFEVLLYLFHILFQTLFFAFIVFGTIIISLGTSLDIFRFALVLGLRLLSSLTSNSLFKNMEDAVTDMSVEQRRAISFLLMVVFVSYTVCVGDKKEAPLKKVKGGQA